MSRQTKYYVESDGGFWYIVSAETAAQAKRDGIREFGRGCVREVRAATMRERASYMATKGQISRAD